MLLLVVDHVFCLPHRLHPYFKATTRKTRDALPSTVASVARANYLLRGWSRDASFYCILSKSLNKITRQPMYENYYCMNTFINKQLWGGRGATSIATVRSRVPVPTTRTQSSTCSIIYHARTTNNIGSEL